MPQLTSQIRRQTPEAEIKGAADDIVIKAIIFDFNGVIIDDEPIQLLAYQEVLGAENITLSIDEYYGCLGMNDVTFVQAAFTRAGKVLTGALLEDVIQRKTIAHGKMLEKDLPMFGGVITFTKAASRKFLLGIVSMARRVEINEILKRAGLESLFDAVVSAEDVDSCKPDPACYVLGLRLINEAGRSAGQYPILPAECLAIEDSPPGIESARGAGMRTLGVINTVSSEELRASGADVVTKSLADWTIDAVLHVFD